MDGRHSLLGIIICVLLKPALINGFEKCTAGISAEECFVGRCCKIGDKWECRTGDLSDCQSLAQPDEIIPEKPVSNENDKDTLAIPLGVAAACLVLLVVFGIVTVCIWRKYRNRGIPTSQGRLSSITLGGSSSTNRLIDEPKEPPVWNTKTHKEENRGQHYKDRSRARQDTRDGATKISASKREATPSYQNNENSQATKWNQSPSNRNINSKQTPKRDHQTSSHRENKNNPDSRREQTPVNRGRGPRRHQREDRSHQQLPLHVNENPPPYGDDRLDRLGNGRPPSYAEAIAIPMSMSTEV